jgi:hypothetical protein
MHLILHRRTGEPFKIGPGSRFALFHDTKTYFIFDAQGYAASCNGKTVSEFRARSISNFRSMVNLLANAPKRRCRVLLLQKTDQMTIYKLISVC